MSRLVYVYGSAWLQPGPIDMRGSAATGSLMHSPLKAAPALPPSSFRPHRPIRVGQPAGVLQRPCMSCVPVPLHLQLQ